jgi:hypothetical protein
VEVALGRIDTLDVMGSGYGALLRLWYRLLKCGFHIPSAAGTGVFLNQREMRRYQFGRQATSAAGPPVLCVHSNPRVLFVNHCPAQSFTQPSPRAGRGCGFTSA